MSFREQAAGIIHAAGVLSGAAAVAFISSLPQSAATMFLWPWCGVYVVAAAGPWIALLGRCLSGRSPVQWPAGWWRGAVLASALALAASTLASPFRVEIAVWLLMPLAGIGWFLVTVDFIRYSSARDRRRMIIAFALLGGALSVASLAMWISKLQFRWTVAESYPDSLPTGLLGRLAWCFQQRNDEPLGHVNYTAGLALLFLPWPLWLAWVARGWRRAGWLLVAALLLLVEISSGSRGGMFGLGAMSVAAAAVAWVLLPNRRSIIGLWAGIGIVLMGALVIGHPGMRARLFVHTAVDGPNRSNMERAGMLSIAWRAGLDRPLAGWGIGSVPLIYDRFRGTEEFGAINALQVHSTPANLWMEGGALFVGAAALWAGLVAAGGWRLVRRRALTACDGAWAAMCTLFGYGLFGLTDYQLDLPIVMLLLPCSAGVIAADSSGVDGPVQRPTVSLNALGRICALAGTAIPLILIACAATPWARSRAALARGELDRAQAILPYDSVLAVMQGLAWAERAAQVAEPGEREELRRRARADLTRAMASGAHREVCHFNLGWLLLEEEPKAARDHFFRVLGVAPARAGAWLGVGIASIRLGEASAAVEALSLECLAHPSFVSSGWWTRDDVGPYRDRVLTDLVGKLNGIVTRGSADAWPGRQALYYRELVRWLRSESQSHAVAALAVNPSTKEFFMGEDPPSRQVRMLQAATAGEIPAMGMLGAFLQRLGIERPGTAMAMLEFLRDKDVSEAARAILNPSIQNQPPVISVYPRRQGFGVRQRNPYAQHVADCMPEYRNILAECFLPGVPLPHGWIFDQTLLGLADADLRNAVNAAAALSARESPTGANG